MLKDDDQQQIRAAPKASAGPRTHSQEGDPRLCPLHQFHSAVGHATF